MACLDFVFVFSHCNIFLQQYRLCLVHKTSDFHLIQKIKYHTCLCVCVCGGGGGGQTQNHLNLEAGVKTTWPPPVLLSENHLMVQRWSWLFSKLHIFSGEKNTCPHYKTLLIMQQLSSPPPQWLQSAEQWVGVALRVTFDPHWSGFIPCACIHKFHL